MPSDVITALRKQLREKFPSAHRGEQGHPVPHSFSDGGSRPVVSPQQPEAPQTTAPQRSQSNPPSVTSREGLSPTPQPHPGSLNSHQRSSYSPDTRREAPNSPWNFELGTSNFPTGAITEISPGHPSCGLSLIVAALLAEDDQTDSPLALIDARDRFDPASFTPEECARLLWLRCRDTSQALRATDLLLRDGNLPFVLLDLSALPARELRRIPNSSWHRLRQLAETTDVTLLALTPTPLIPRTALRLTLTHPITLDDLHLSRPELLTLLQTQTTRRLHQIA